MKRNTVLCSKFYLFIAVLVIIFCMLGCPRSPKGKIGLWKQLNPNPSLWVTPRYDFEVLDVQVVDSNFIVAVGSNKMFLRTSNFGNTWLPFRTLPSTMQTVHFVNRDTGYAGGNPTTYEIGRGEGIKIYRTTNGGITWENVLTPLTGPREVITEDDYICSPAVEAGINDIYFTDENNGIAVGGDLIYGGIALWTNDGGQTWSWNNAQGGELNAIDFANANLGIAVGGLWAALDIHAVRTTQGITGQPEECDGPGELLGWDDLEPNIQTGLGGTLGTLTGISFLDDTTAYVTGNMMVYNGYGIFGTMDIGESWDTIFTTEGKLGDVILFDLSYPTSDAGTVVGSDGLILYNSRSGPAPLYWQTQPCNSNVNLTCVDFISPDRGVIGGQGNSILTTKNGGESWDGPRSFTVRDLHTIKALNDDFLAVCGDRGTIAVSQDSGKTWCLQCTGTTRSILDIAYSYPTSGIAVGWHGYVVYTDDGHEWHIPDSYPLATSCTSENLHMNGVDFFTDTRAVIVGKKRMATTEDAGHTWIERSIPQSLDAYTHLRDVACLDADRAVAVGYNGIIIRTEDGGQTWTTIQRSISDHLCGVYFSDSQHGWAVGYDTGDTEDFNPFNSYEGIVMYTEDGGLTWIKQYRNQGVVLTDVHFIDQNTGIAVGGKGSSLNSSSTSYWGYILVTRDGGATWNVADLPKAENLRGIRTFSDGRVYIAGSRGFIARTDSLPQL